MGYTILQLEQNGNYFEFIAQEVRRVKHVAKKYSKGYNIFDKIITHLQLLSLQKFAKTNNNSEELLSFNTFVFAQKK